MRLSRHLKYLSTASGRIMIQRVMLSIGGLSMIESITC